jgi:hypothetical protein
MSLNSLDIVTIRNDMGISPLRCVVSKVDKNSVAIKLNNDFVSMSYLVGDHINLNVEKDSLVYLVTARIVNINLHAGLIDLYMKNIIKYKDRRREKRYVVSLYADSWNIGEDKRHLTTIKNIALYGAAICTRGDYKVNTKIVLKICHNNAEFNLTAKVVRSVHERSFTRYGLIFEYDSDETILNRNKEFIDSLRTEEDDEYMKLKGQI